MAKRTRKQTKPQTPPVELPPLLLTLAINRQTGKVARLHNAQNAFAEDDLRLLLEALALMENDIRETLVQLAEERGRQAGKEKTDG